MTRIFIGIGFILLFVGGSTLLAFFYPGLGWPLSAVSALGGTIGGSLIVTGALGLRTR